MMWGYGYDWGWPGMLMMSLNSILWIVLIAVLIWAIVRWTGKRNASTTPSAMEILRQRYARGDIDAATFAQMHEQLETHIREPLVQSGKFRGDMH